jgi:prophage regulatory protein
MPEHHPSAPERLITIAEVVDRVGVNRSTVYRRIRTGEFPPPVHLGTRTSRWRESEVNAWIGKLGT